MMFWLCPCFSSLVGRCGSSGGSMVPGPLSGGKPPPNMPPSPFPFFIMSPSASEEELLCWLRRSFRLPRPPPLPSFRSDWGKKAVIRGIFWSMGLPPPPFHYCLLFKKKLWKEKFPLTSDIFVLDIYYWQESCLLIGNYTFYKRK